MNKERFQLTSAAAIVYEEQKVPAIFGPLAHATLALHDVASSDSVLDVACGTGIVARTVRERFGDATAVTAIDLNAGMVATGRATCARAGIDVDFAVCDATRTPFGDGVFTFIVCQQGFQYFPDEDAVLRELHRVAARDCRFVFSVWSRPGPFFLALANSLRTHIGAEAASQSLAPFSWAGVDTIVERMTAAGYYEVQLRELEVERVVDEPKAGIAREIMSNPVGQVVSAAGEAALEAVVADTLAATARFLRDQQLVVPQHTHLISAKAR